MLAAARTDRAWPKSDGLVPRILRNDDADAPDFARTCRHPSQNRVRPVELFIEPAAPLRRARLLQEKKLRHALQDGRHFPLDARLVSRQVTCCRDPTPKARSSSAPATLPDEMNRVRDYRDIRCL